MLRKYIILLSSFCFLVCFSQFLNGQNSTQTDKQKVPIVVPSATVDEKISLLEGKVVLIYDGDTLSVETKDRKIYSLRLQGIDAPEDKQNYGKKSRKALAALIEGKDVKVIIHKKDLYDRYVASVYLNGEDVALTQIETGMAWHFKRYGSEQQSEERKKYAQAELKARADKVGLWKDDDPTPPWDYREGKKPNVPDKNAELQQNKNTTVETSGDKPTERKYILGPRGGCYYVNASGRKVYVDDKRLCGVQ